MIRVEFFVCTKCGYKWTPQENYDKQLNRVRKDCPKCGNNTFEIYVKTIKN